MRIGNIEKFLNSVVPIRLHALLFYIFLFTFPFNIRKAFLSDYSYFTGHFVEDTTFFLNLSDIFLVLVIVFATAHILRNHLQNDFLHFLKKYRVVFWVLGALVIWSCVGIVYAKSQDFVFMGTIKILEVGFLFTYVAYFFRDFSLLFTSWKIIVISSFVQSSIAIAQYIIQKSLGLRVVGESIIGKDLPGVAKIVVDGEKIVRPYGTFGHPNILGGFLVFSLSISLLLYVSKTKKSKNLFYFTFAGLLSIMIFDHYLVTNQQGQILLWLTLGLLFVGDHTSDKVRDVISNKHGYLTAAIIIQCIALILTYSRTAWLAFGFVVTGFAVLFFKKTLRDYWFQVLGIAIIMLLLLFTVLPLKTRIQESFAIRNQAIEDRLLGIRTAFRVIKTHPLVGVGNKNYVINIDTYETRSLEHWQYQPVHNSYLLIWSELGLIGLALFIVFAFFVAAHHFVSRSASEH